MDRISERAAQWGIETEYQDGLGRRRVVEPQVLARLLDMALKGDTFYGRFAPSAAKAA